jgi:hypothetical protein
VLDDTAGNCVEYVNEGGVKALGRGYLDLFGQPAVDLVDQGLEPQVRGPRASSGCSTGVGVLLAVYCPHLA